MIIQKKFFQALWQQFLFLFFQWFIPKKPQSIKQMKVEVSPQIPSLSLHLLWTHQGAPALHLCIDHFSFVIPLSRYLHCLLLLFLQWSAHVSLGTHVSLTLSHFFYSPIIDILCIQFSYSYSGKSWQGYTWRPALHIYKYLKVISQANK